ncbi:MAG: hypothetical protein AB7F40_06185 [Victivallaceae bacterium]|nr:hypothetical protein [Victivallaceae bacterium]
MRLFYWLAVAALLFAAGCVDIDYVGQKLAPLPDDQLVTFFEEKVDYDPARYREIGRATVTAPDGTSMLDIKEDMQDKARAVGASAVKIISFSRVDTGVVYMTSAAGNDTPQAADQANQSRAVGGNPVYTDSFGQTGTLTTTAEPRYEVVLHVLFLADAAKFDVAMSERKARQAQDLEAAAKEPAPLPPISAAEAAASEVSE